jgi:hypothetical protein
MQKKAKNGNSIVKVLRKGDDWEIIKETFPLLSLTLSPSHPHFFFLH